MIIQIDHDVTDAVVARVQQLLDDSAARDADFNGVDFVIERGDGTCIVDAGPSDPYDVARLFQAVQEEIDGTRESVFGYRSVSTGTHFKA